MKFFTLSSIALMLFTSSFSELISNNLSDSQLSGQNNYQEKVEGVSTNIRHLQVRGPNPPVDPKGPNPPPVDPKGPNPVDPLLQLKDIPSRNYNGTFINLKNDVWGSTGQTQPRLCQANYKDGKSQMWTNKPNPREVSNFVGDLSGQITLSQANWNMLFPIWGQFLDHDITLTKFGKTQSIPISVPMCDAWFDQSCTGIQQISFTRSGHDTSQQVRTQINLNTAWVDGGQIYGSDKTTADSLRSFSNGKLITSDGNMLPKGTDGFYKAGDIRANQNIGLTSLHTIFMREHNRICDLILAKSSPLEDEDIYQMARKYVIGLVQHITYDEYLASLLGKKLFDQIIGVYQSQPGENPNINTQFSTAAYRLGHPMINAPFKLMDNDGKLINTIQIGEMFFNPNLVTKESVSQILNGLIRTNSKQRSLELVDDLRNFLVFQQGSSSKLDLFALNVQRGRDHGICSLKKAREYYGLGDANFTNLFANPQKAQNLRVLYQTTDNVDLWVGIIGQKSEPKSDLGLLGAKIVGEQFKKIRNSDSQWYQAILPPPVVKQIKNTLLGDVIKRNTIIVNISSPRSFVKFG